jgi:hypothetical protein
VALQEGQDAFVRLQKFGKCNLKRGIYSTNSERLNVNKEFSNSPKDFWVDFFASTPPGRGGGRVKILRKWT